jgi:hypothetical protein
MILLRDVDDRNDFRTEGIEGIPFLCAELRLLVGWCDWSSKSRLSGHQYRARIWEKENRRSDTSDGKGVFVSRGTSEPRCRA